MGLYQFRLCDTKFCEHDQRRCGFCFVYWGGGGHSSHMFVHTQDYPVPFCKVMVFLNTR